MWYNLPIAVYHRSSTREEAHVSSLETVAIYFLSALPAKATTLELEAPFDACEPTIFVRNRIQHILLHAGSGRLYGDAPDKSCAFVARLRSASGH
jgi:hypothetical protein